LESVDAGEVTGAVVVVVVVDAEGGFANRTDITLAPDSLNK